MEITTLQNNVQNFTTQWDELLSELSADFPAFSVYVHRWCWQVLTEVYYIAFFCVYLVKHHKHFCII